jgi:hypothetical protein
VYLKTWISVLLISLIIGNNVPYPNDDYISVEDELRKRQMLQMQQGIEQPYAEDMGNMPDISTQLQQQMGSADYAELLRQGASAQKGASTTHYNPMLDYQKGRFGEGEEGYNPYTQGQRPGALALSSGQAGVGAGLASMALRYGGSRMQSRAMSGPQQGWEQRIGSYGLTGAERVALNPGFVQQYGDPQSGLLSGGQMLDPMATGRGMAQMGQFGLDTGMKMWSDTSPHELYKTMLIERGATTPKPTGPGTGGPTGIQTGTGMAAGALTSYLINRYTNAPGGVSEIAGGVVGGGVAGGMGGVGAAGATAAAGGAAAGSPAAFAAGGIVGGAAALGIHVLSNIVAKHVFGGGKESGKDVGARQLYRQYHGRWADKAAKGAGFEDRDQMLAQPYAWMTDEAKQFRADNPDFDYSKGTLKQRGYEAPEYKPTAWEAWAGGMHNLGYKMSNIFDATAFYSSEKGSKARAQALGQRKLGEEYWLSGKGDRGKDLTQEDRQKRWDDIQGRAKEMELPWMTDAFKSAYEEQYGDMETKKFMTAKQFRKQIGKRSWFERHGQMGRYHRLFAEKTGTGLGAQALRGQAVRVNFPTTASVGDRFARMGATMSAYDKRDLYGEGQYEYRGTNAPDSDAQDDLNS